VKPGTAAALMLVPAACAGDARPPELVRAERLRDVAAITARCGVPNDTLKLVGRDELHIQPRQDAEFERIGCLLEEVQKLPYRLHLGFVGNEAYGREPK
jgi:hypothetical protein